LNSLIFNRKVFRGFELYADLFNRREHKDSKATVAEILTTEDAEFTELDAEFKIREILTICV
jgi:hypothetical protein